MAGILKAKQNENTGKWYPRIVNLKTMSLEDLCEHIAEHGSVWTPDVVTGVVKKFVGCISEQLLQSKKVRLDGIGTFYLRPLYPMGRDSKGYPKFGGTDTKEDLNFSNCYFVVGFTPDRSDNSKFTRPNVTRAASTQTIGSLGLQENLGGGNYPGGGNGGNGGGVEEQP